MVHGLLRDALNVVLAWCNGTLPGFRAAAERTDANPFQDFSASLAMPLYSRMFALAALGRIFRDPEPLRKSAAEVAW